MFTAFVRGDQEAAATAVGDADQLQIMRSEQAAGRVFLSTAFVFEQLHDPGKFFVIQFDAGCELHRFREDWRSVEGLPEVDIENADCLWAGSLQEAADG